MTYPEKLTYSIKETCRVTSLSRSTVYKAIADQRLRIIRVGGRTLIPAESLRGFLAGEA